MSATREEIIADLNYCKESLNRIVKYTERNYKDSLLDNHHTVIQADIIKLRRDLNEVNHKLNWDYDRK
jgi:hypothetical protein